MKKNSKIKNGGKVISSGGFGCVFYPSLKCKTKKRNFNEITKLMTKKHAKQEYDEIKEVKEKLQDIPNFEDYFLIKEFTICQPDTLTKEDLENFNKKCSALRKRNITSDNINQRLDELSGITMPHGGIDVGDFIKVNTSQQMLEKLNDSLIKLLTHGIIPMNKAHIYHCDVKESNVLVKKENEQLMTRLIDWGLTMHYELHNKIPSIICNRPFQYNLPFSIILFNKIFIKKYKKFLKKKKELEYDSLQKFTKKYVSYWVDIRGAGHLKLINSNIKHLGLTKDDKPEIKEGISVITYDYIVEYISQILYTFTKEGVFNLEKYFQIFVSNVDIWGFVMIYIPFVRHLSEHYNELSSIEKELFEKFKYIFRHFLFENATTSIDTDELVIELKQLNLLIDKTKITERNTLSSSSSSNKSQKIRKRTKTNTTKSNWKSKIKIK